MMHEQAGDTKWKAKSAFRTTDLLVQQLRTDQCTFPELKMLENAHRRCVNVRQWRGVMDAELQVTYFEGIPPF
jgi:hypothetical protein